MLALIMAGGSGTRFWPKSRMNHPKQLLNILDDKTLIQNTIDRLQPLIPQSNIHIVSTQLQQPLIKQQLPDLPHANYITEPQGKNTAPCIGLAALFLEKIDPESVMVVLPADHLIMDNELFHRTLEAGAAIARDSGSIVTIGIEPTYPATGYGYIQCAEPSVSSADINAYQVKAFAEKPDLPTARRFVESGDFLWNSGIFIWKTKTILREIEENIPKLFEGLQEIKQAIGTSKERAEIERVYGEIQGISIDYGVMEHAKNVQVLRAKFRWNDLGSWDEVYKLQKKDNHENVLVGKHIVTDSSGCLVDSPERCVALVGVDNLIVVDTGDAILICPRDRAQDVKNVVELAKQNKMTQLI